MRILLLTLLALFVASPAVAQLPVAPLPVAPPLVALPPLNPADPVAAYITAGQDEAGYRVWSAATPDHVSSVTRLSRYLATWGVGGILPTWQLLRTASSWQRCGAEPFEVPPAGDWPNLVQTLRYIHEYVIPAVGPVEAVSAYRNPSLNACAGGAPESAHKHYSAVDMVPLRPTTREALMRTLCAIHADRGPAYGVGLGFYAFLRFHVDTTKFRRWGTDAAAGCPPIIHPEDIGTVALPPPEPTPAVMPPVTGPGLVLTTQPAVQPPLQTSPPTADPLAPKRPR